MRKVIAIVVAGLAMFMLAGLYTGVLAKGFMTAHVDMAMIRTSPNLAMIAVGYMFLALLMTLIFPHVKGMAIGSVKSGVLFGMISGVVWLMPYSVVLFGVYRFPYIALPVDFVWALVEQGVGGILISLILGKQKSFT